MTVERYFANAKHGKPAHVWQGVTKREALKSADEKARPWSFRCPAPMCFYNVSAATEKDARRIEETHPCPWFGGGTTTLGWGVMSEQFVKPIWSFLDAAMDVIKSEQLDAISADNRERAKQEARAYANVLAVLMPPFFSHPDEIAREAMVRWQKRKAGEDYETPGMGRLRYKPPNTTLTTAGLPKTDTSIQMTTKVIELDDATQKGIKAALESGLFTAKQLAATYSVSEAYIQSLA